MQCDDIHEDLVAYMDDELSSIEMRAIEEHLATCPDCTAEGRKLRETLARTQQVEAIQPTQNWWEKLQERMHSLESDFFSGANNSSKTHLRLDKIRGHAPQTAGEAEET